MYLHDLNSRNSWHRHGVHGLEEADHVTARAHFEVIAPEEHACWIQRKRNMYQPSERSMNIKFNVSSYFISLWTEPPHWSLLCSCKLKIFSKFATLLWYPYHWNKYVTCRTVRCILGLWSVELWHRIVWHIVYFSEKPTTSRNVDLYWPHYMVSQPRIPQSKFSLPCKLRILCSNVCCLFNDAFTC
jgi:hypothetical protein